MDREQHVPMPEEICARVRAAGLTLTYDAADRALTADTPSRERIAIG
jgi:hypothetical protein